MNLKKDILEGFFIGVLSNFSGVYLYVGIATDYDLFDAIELAYHDEFLGALIAIGAILNFIPFFVYLKKDKVYKARGVLLLSILMALVILYLNITNL